MSQGRREFTTIALCALAIIFSGCGKKDEGQSSQSTPTQGGQTAGQAAGDQAPTPEQMAKLAEENRQAIAQMNQGKVVQAVPGETLKALLPADLPGMKRTDASAERTQTMGFDMSKAEGQYSGGDNGEARITVTINDLGSMTGAMRMGMMAWTMTQYSRETDSGYEKTITYKGHKGMEKYNNNDKDGNIQILVADRFMVEVDGSGVTVDLLKQALDKIDLAKLSSAASGS